MNMETYNAINAYIDQAISIRGNSFGIYVVLYGDDKETAAEIITIARNAGHKVTKRIIGRGEPDSEISIFIR